MSPAVQNQFEQLTDYRNWDEEGFNRLASFLQQNNALRFEALYDDRIKGRHVGESTPVQLVVSGNRSNPVLIQGMRVRILKRGAPISGTLIYGEAQGEGNTVDLAFNLDSPNPIALRLDQRGLPTRQPYFSKKFVTLKLGEPIVFNIRAYTKTCSCEWELVIDTVVGGKTHKLVVRDEGQPFRTSAFARSYLVAYSAFSTSKTHVFTRMRTGWTPLSEN